MLDSDFWRDLADKFRALPDPHGLLYARWSSTVGGWNLPTWHVSIVGSSLGPNTAVVQFNALAVRAGAALKLNSGDRDLRDVWLDEVRKETPSERTFQGSNADHIGGRIDKLSEASANL